MDVIGNYSTKEETLPVVKRMYWLGWQACGGPMGMGVFQNRPEANEDAVYDNISRGADYPGETNLATGGRDNEWYGDYVFGRMMKLSMVYIPETGELKASGGISPDYNAWAGKYPDSQSLHDAAVESLAAEA